MSNWVVENIELFLPRYLTDTTASGLIDSLRQFPDNVDQRLYLGSLAASEPMLQGDGIEELTVCHLSTRSFYDAPCVVLSNSCDIDPANERHTPVNICYAPIFRLDKYRQELERKYDHGKATSVVESIRKQRVTQYFYLPSGLGLSYEGVVFLDQVCSAPPTPEFHAQMKARRIFTLSQYGFYLFLFKLSVHFTRMGEGVDRDTSKVAAQSAAS